jgi:radical SAM enzyme (TIGR01210 family)
MPPQVLVQIAQAVGAALPNVSKLVFETRLEFISVSTLQQLSTVSRKQVDILTGFETLDEHIRDVLLTKKEPISRFLSALDRVAAARAALTAYVLFKPSPTMTDEDAVLEARASIKFLETECSLRAIPLTIRLNPMYAARGTPWRQRAEQELLYLPPRITDVLTVAREARERGIPTYIGLTSEGLSEDRFTYRAREDFSTALLKEAIIENTRGLLRAPASNGANRLTNE